MENTLELLKELTLRPQNDVGRRWRFRGQRKPRRRHQGLRRCTTVGRPSRPTTGTSTSSWRRIDGIQFVEATSHGDLKSYYVRFSHDWDETLVRCYFPNPYLDDDEKRTELQPEKLRAFRRGSRPLGRQGGRPGLRGTLTQRNSPIYRTAGRYCAIRRRGTRMPPVDETQNVHPSQEE